MSFTINCRVVQMETGRGVASVGVEAFDADVIHDDPLGTGQTDASGTCSIPVRTSFWQLDRPDVYLVVKATDGRVLASTRGAFLRDVIKDVAIEVPISCYRLVEAGVMSRQDLPPELSSVDVPKAMRELTLASGQDGDADGDALLGEIQRDLSGSATALELLKSYTSSLHGSTDNQAPAFQKLGRLFRAGRDLATMEGHHYGIAIGLRLSGEKHPFYHLDNIVGLLWSTTLADESPWVGKSFRPGDEATLRSLPGAQAANVRPPSLGSNHFVSLPWHPANNISFSALTYWLKLSDAPKGEQEAFGYQRNGGNFTAGPAPSVCAETPRQVYSLNYRWPVLDNRPPLSWLIDELVQISDGLFLGQLLFATRRLLGSFDASVPADAYGYQHMGYFALWDKRWNGEARRLFPFLNIPVTAPGLVRDAGSVEISASSRELKLDDRPPATCSDQVFAEVRSDLAKRETILHLLRDYAKDLENGLDNSSPLFLRLQELFNRAAPVSSMRGFHRGALVSWHSAGLLDLFAKNALNLVWKGFAARFSTWTGKSFDPISRERLMELTDGFEKGDLPSTWGANTQALRTMKEREVGQMMKLAKIWTEPASNVESVNFGYDVKNFFFIAHPGTSVNPACGGKRIYQFNYRWPKLHTIPPDCFCIDELVELADGLYLGQLMYATDWTKPYDPRQSPDIYRYGMFGYFLLMNEPWHQLRLRIGFDLENV